MFEADGSKAVALGEGHERNLARAAEAWGLCEDQVLGARGIAVAVLGNMLAHGRRTVRESAKALGVSPEVAEGVLLGVGL